MKNISIFISILTLIVGCSPSESNDNIQDRFPNITSIFAGKINLSSLDQYTSQSIPFYISKDNMPSTNLVTDAGATLGRVLFYDKNLSTNNSTSCASCHIQAHAFGDLSLVSVGANGNTGRHSMRLINSRFSDDSTFFWDERAATLEAQTTQPIRDHNEMGFSGANGAPSFDDLIIKMNSVPYYPEFFELVFGDSSITESRMQSALAQFIRSIQSFDSKYDLGRESAPNDTAPFFNFTPDENAGKMLFFDNPPSGGANCATCHRPPEFDISPGPFGDRNNGNIGTFGSGVLDIIVTRSPTLRDLVDPSGNTNGNYMHDAKHSTLASVIDHYDSGIVDNANLDPRLLGPGSVPQNLNLTGTEKLQLELFLRTLTGSDVYTNPKWSSPF